MKKYRKWNSADSLKDLGPLLEKSGITVETLDRGIPDIREKTVQLPAAGKRTCISGIGVGQRVVLMDSNLYGTVVRAGVKATVLLEDGMEIETDYVEIAAADLEEDRILGNAHVRNSGQESLCRLPHSFSRCLTVDLHISSLPGGNSVHEGRQLEFQMKVFRRVLEENLRHRGMRISFIHGMGEGILRRMIHKELDEVYAMSCTYSSGTGKTIVTIR